MEERKKINRGGLAGSVDPAKTYHLANAAITVNGEIEKFLLFYHANIKQLQKVYWSDWIKFLDSQKQIMAMVRDPRTSRRLETFDQWLETIWPLSPYNVEKL